MSGTPPRPVFRHYGGKWRLAPWIVQHLPPHELYVEPFAGAASVLMRKPRAPGEVLNDLDRRIVAVFRCLRDPVLAERLRRQVALTPFALAEYEEAAAETDDLVEQARRTLVRSCMGYGSAGLLGFACGFRRRAYGYRQTGALDWAGWPETVPAFCARLQGVVIDARDALAVMQDHDVPEAVHYVDPPYVIASRAHNAPSYRFEMDEAAHRALLERLRALRGAVVLSAYRHPLYEEVLRGWRCIERPAHTMTASRAVEVLWLNREACRRLEAARLQPLWQT